MDRQTTNKVVGNTKLPQETAIDVAKKDIGEHKEIQSHVQNTYFPADDGLHLSFLIDVVTEEADWRYVVDAYTGDILLKEDRRVEVNGTGNVFDPNPVVTANDNTFLEGTTPEAALNAELVNRTLQDITKSGTKYKLKGPYVEIKNKQPVNIDPPQQTTSTFKYQRNDHEFEAVNIYYHIDQLQRYIQNTLGITNVMNWSIEADHHTSDNGGAFYSPSGKYLGFGGSGPNRPDRGEDGDVMAHEYGHAIQHDIVPGWGVFNATTMRNEARAMGEGFGDTLACMYFHEAGGIYQPEVFEDWIFAPNGLRRVDGVKQYPGEGTTGTTGDWIDQVHADGEIWSAPIWNAYLAAGGNSSSAAARAQARQDILKTLILHHFKLSGNESMPEAAEAMLETNAEIPEIRGRQLMQLLDSFHDRNILRCSSNVDLWIKDQPSHAGAEVVSGKFWDSPDVWIRNNDDNGTAHQQPEFGQDNWFYCRVRNRGTETARAFVVTFEVKIWQGTQFTYENDFLPPISAAVGFNLAPGASTVVKARWPQSEVPSAGSHGCLLVSAYSPTDEAISGKHVWEDNNLAQKNLTIVDLLPDQTTDVTFRIGNLNNVTARRYRIEVTRPLGRENLRLSLVHPNSHVVRNLFRSIRMTTALEPVVTTTMPAAVATTTPVMTLLEPARVRFSAGGVRFPDETGGSMEMSLAPGSEIFASASGSAEGAAPGGVVPDEPGLDAPGFMDTQADLDEEQDATGMSVIHFRPGRIVGFPTFLPARWNPPLKLRLTAPADARPGDEYNVDVVQRDNSGRMVGGISVLLRIK